MECIIRRIMSSDDAAVERVIRSCLVEFGADHDGTAWTDPKLCRMSELYTDEGNCYWVAEAENGAIVGGAGIGRLTDDICELQKMYFLPDMRGTGVSHRIMHIALRYAALYYRRCYIETLENMTAAQMFYEKYGFVRTDEPVVSTAHFSCDVHYIKELR